MKSWGEKNGRIEGLLIDEIDDDFRHEDKLSDTEQSWLVVNYLQVKVNYYY